MTRREPLLSLMLALSAVAGCGGQSDQQLLQGSWGVVSYTMNGKVVPEDIRSRLRVVIEEDKITLTPFVLSQPDGRFEIDKESATPAVFTLAGGNPKTIDLRVELDGKAVTVRGIYQLEGDSLKLCTAFSGSKDRPSAFTSAADSRQSLFVLKRERKE
jgi:uncharacterized protein (TIGR03067 family)